MGGRGATSSINQFYQNRLNSIDSEIKQKQRLASLSNSTSATVRKKANNAIRSIERLEKQYNEIERQARRQRNSPLF